MSTADKLTQIAENVQRVYDAGYEKGKSEGGGGGNGTLVCALIEANQENAFRAIQEAEVSFPNAETVDYAGFMECFELRKVDLPIATTIDKQAFQGCRELTDVNMPEVLTIGAAAFAKCYSLTRVDLPKCVSIDDEAFQSCMNLSTLILRDTSQVCVINSVTVVLDTKIINSYWSPTGEGFIYVPASMFEMYRSVYEPGFEQLGAAGLFDIIFRKIEDYPEICG